MRNNPLNSALFLTGFHQRLRSNNIFAYTILIFLTIGVIFANEINKSVNVNEWVSQVIFKLGILQGIILIGVGSLSAYKLANQEQSSGTLLYHQKSSNSQSLKVLGLLFGSTSLEWILFLLIALFQLFFLKLSEYSFIPLIQFYALIAVCSLNFQTGGLIIGLLKKTQKQLLSLVQVSILFAFLIYLFLTHQLAFSTFLYWQPAYDFLGQNYLSASPEYLIFVDVWSQYVQYPLSIIIVYFIFQIPIFMILSNILSKQLSAQKFNLISKGQSLALSAYTLFFFSAGILFNAINPSQESFDPSLSRIILFNIVLLLAIGASFIHANEFLEYRKNMRMAIKSKWKGLNHISNRFSNTIWLIQYICIVTFVFSMFIFYYQLTINEAIIHLLMLLVYPIFFVTAFEYFRIRFPQRSQNYFGLFLLIVWIIIPLSYFALSNKIPEQYYFLDNYILAFSPIFGGYNCLGANPIDFSFAWNHLHYSSLITAYALTMVTSILLYIEKKQMRKDITSELNKSI